MTWLEIILASLERFLPEILEIGRKHGLPMPTEKEIEDAANKVAAKALPMLVAGIGPLAQAANVAIQADLAKLPQVERCPQCGNVLTHEINHAGKITYTCDTCHYSLQPGHDGQLFSNTLAPAPPRHPPPPWHEQVDAMTAPPVRETEVLTADDVVTSPVDDIVFDE